MLGRVRRTTRTDVALALVMAGIVYLAWVLACGVARSSAAGLQALPNLPEEGSLSLAFLNVFGSWGAALFDVFGMLWMIASLWLIMRASRQRGIISWSWLLLSCQGLVALLVAVWSAWASRQAGGVAPDASHVGNEWSPAIIAVAVLIWVATLVWLVLDGMRLRRRRPAITDGFKTHTYRQ